jgi:hypothetical protein
MDGENIRRKIQKLFEAAELGEGNEADIALRKAREFMMSYGLTEDDINLHVLDVPTGRKEKWIIMLCRSCAEFSGVACLAGRENVAFAGDKIGASVALELFNYLKGEINRRTEKSGAAGRKRKNDFRVGCVIGIEDKMEKTEGWRDMKEKRRHIIEKHFRDKKIWTERKRSVDRDSYRAGQKAGEDINLGRQAGYSGAAGFLDNKGALG